MCVCVFVCCLKSANIFEKRKSLLLSKATIVGYRFTREGCTGLPGLHLLSVVEMLVSQNKSLTTNK